MAESAPPTMSAAHSERGPRPGAVIIRLARDEAEKEVSAATPAQVLGDMVFLAMKSPEHRGRSLAEFEALAVPAIMTKQFRLWRNDTQPIALAVWAMASEEVADRIAAGERALSPAEWRSGETFVIVDLIAPYGGKEGFERALREWVGGGT